MMRRILLVLLATSSWNCDIVGPHACDAMARAGLTVSVTNAATGQPICHATVTATEGAYSERLMAVGCSFSGAYERPGTYVIRATAAGFQPKESGTIRVVMGGGECPHVDQVRVTISLSPDGQP